MLFLRASAATCLLLLVVLGAALAREGHAQAPAPSSPEPSAAQEAPPSGLPQDKAQALRDLLDDPEARDALIEALDAVASGAVAADEAPDAAPAADQAASDEGSPVSFVREVAQQTQAAAEGLANRTLLLWQRIQNAPRIFAGLRGTEVDVLVDALVSIAMVVAASFGVFLTLRFFAKRLYRRMGAAITEASMLRRIALVSVSILVDALVVALAWAAGYVLALTAFGDVGAIGIRQTLFLNAFLIVEMIKVGLRSVLSPATGALRLISIPDQGARVTSRWLNIVVSLVGYGQLLIVPVINQQVSFFAGRSVSAIILLVALIILAGLVMWHRRPVAGWLLGERHLEDRGGFLRFLARNWHVPALIYLATIFVIVVTRPGGMLGPVLNASGQVFLAAILGMMVTGAIKRSMSQGVRLPVGIRQRLPLLERRLNAFVPRVLFFMRQIVVLAVLAFIAHTLDIIDARGWLESQIGVRLTTVVVSVSLVVIVAFVIWLSLSSWIDYRLNPDFGSVATAREQTLLTLLRNAATIIIVVITTMFVLSELGIDIAPLIASAGVLGLAIGFGAQKLVQDIITGIFIQFENAMNVGDVVTVSGTTGTVERLTIRSVSLRDLEGVFHTIPFSSVDMVSNYMREFGYFVCDMGIAYRESVSEAREAMQDAFEELRAMPDWRHAIMGDMQWFGLVSFGDSAVVVRARIKCTPGQQWGVGRAYNEIVKRIFDERGIEIPFPHQTLFFGEDKDGRAPPLRLARAQGNQ